MVKFKHIVLIAFILSSCGNQEREKQLEMREQVLLEKESQFASKEIEYAKLILMRDSLLKAMDKETIAPDSIKVYEWPASIAGTWNSKTICRTSNCGSYVIGDQRNELWEFASDSTGLLTKVFNNNKLTRVLSGTFDAGEIRLHFTSDTTSQRIMETTLTLNQINDDLLRGTQDIQVDNNCIASFSVELTPVSK